MTIDLFIAHFVEATDFLEPVEITADSLLRDLPEWDSLAALGVIVMFDTVYAQTITGDHLHKALTVGDLHRLVG